MKTQFNNQFTQFTLIIPTYGRYTCLRRLLTFYKGYGFPFPIIVLDSCGGPEADDDMLQLLESPQVVWKKFTPAVEFAQKLAEGCEYLKTEYAALCADDDFLLPNGILAALRCIKENPEVSSVVGKVFNHQLLGQNQRILLSSLYNPTASATQPTAAARVEWYLGGGLEHLPFYGVQRSKLLQETWRNTTEHAGSLGLEELYVSSACLIAGHMLTIPEFYSSREINSVDMIDADARRRVFSPQKMKQFGVGLSSLIHKADGGSLSDVQAAMDKTVSIWIENDIATTDRKIHTFRNQPQSTPLRRLIGRTKSTYVQTMTQLRIAMSGSYGDFKALHKALLGSAPVDEEIRQAREVLAETLK